MAVRILLVEDDDGVAGALTSALRAQQRLVDRVGTAAAAAERIERGEPSVDLVLLDMGLPDQDGLALARRIRADHDVPIIAVTARRGEDSVLAGLRAGVDDYVTKPFSLEELLARIDAVMRRYGHRPVDPVAELGTVRIELGGRRAYLDGTELTLTRKEFDLLVALTRAAGDVVTREALMEAAWDTSWVGASRTLDVHVGTLRAKLGRPAVVQTVRGVGYRLAPDAV